MKVDLSRLKSLDIHDKAAFIGDFYGKILFSPCGIAYTMQRIDGDDIRPFRPSDFEGYEVPNFASWGGDQVTDAVGYYGNENSISTSGQFLASQSLRYRVTGEREAYDNALKAFESLWLIYRLSADVGKPGFMCKPYGFVRSNQTSGDQYIHCSLGLFEFYQIADEAHRARVREMGENFVRYWESQDYTLYYFNSRWDMKGDRYCYNAILVALNVAAWHYSGNDEYLRKAEKLFEKARWAVETNVDELRHTFEQQLRDIQAGKKVSKGKFQDLFADRFLPEEFLFWESNILAQFVAISADLIHRIKPDLLGLDMNAILGRWLAIWSYGVEDYAPYYWYCVNIRDGSWRPAGNSEPVAREHWFAGELFMGYLSRIRWGEPLARFMYVSVLAAQYAQGAERASRLGVGEGIMNAIDEKRIQWMFDFDGEQLLPPIRHMYNILSSEVPTTYLASYWKARSLGLI